MYSEEILVHADEKVPYRYGFIAALSQSSILLTDVA